MTVELYIKFCVDLYPKRGFHENLQVVGFLIAGHIWKERHNAKSQEVRMMKLKGLSKVNEKVETVEWDSAGSESD